MGCRELQLNNQFFFVDSDEKEPHPCKFVFIRGSEGFQTIVTNPSGTDMLYSGEQFDPNLQMQYLRARYYDQNNGRFNRLDPFSGNNYDLQSLHKYGYAHSEPVMNYDPTGKIKATAAVFGMVAHLVIQAHYALEKGNFSEMLDASTNVISALELLVPLLKSGVEEISADAAFLLDLISFRPDITNRMTGEMFEIKPNNPRSIANGQTQLAGYVAKLTLLKPLIPPLVWHPGVNWHNSFYPLGVASIRATFLGNGMIVYDRIGAWRDWLRQPEFKRVMDAAAIALGSVALFQLVQITAVNGLIIGKVASLAGVVQYQLGAAMQAVFSRSTVAYGF
jgi:RHS repeat-associated protein